MAAALYRGASAYRSGAYEVRPGAVPGRWCVAGDGPAEERTAREVAVAVSGRSGREVRIDGFHVLSPSAASAPLVILLRELQSIGADVHWRGDLEGIDADDLVHLPPPEPGTAGAPDQSPAARWWRLRHRYGLFYYRQGPGFVSIVDRRRPAEAQRYVMYDPAMLEILRAGLDGEPAGRPGPPAARAAADALREERTVLPFGHLLVTLPCRIRRWPVRYDAV